MSQDDIERDKAFFGDDDSEQEENEEDQMSQTMQ